MQEPISSKSLTDLASSPLVAVIMGSSSDWSTMKNAVEKLEELGIPYETRVVSAHRTPELMFEYVGALEARGVQVLIAGAGGAAHLPGMSASITVLPVIGVPIKSKALKGVDSLLSIVQMPAGIPVATVAIGDAGASNAGLLAAAILGISHPRIREALRAYRNETKAQVLAAPDPRHSTAKEAS